MKPAIHLVTSAAGAMAVHSASGDAGAAAAFFAGGFLIDLDHLVDYCRALGPAEGVRSLAQAALDDALAQRFRPARLYLPLHGWEWAALLLASGGLWGAPWLLALGLGALMHLLLDQRGNGFRPMGYFFLHRALTSFSAARAMKPRYTQAGTQAEGLAPAAVGEG